jgi:hypothetical protein
MPSNDIRDTGLVLVFIVRRGGWHSGAIISLPSDIADLEGALERTGPKL